jgi:hypothetical protein
MPFHYSPLLIIAAIIDAIIFITLRQMPLIIDISPLLIIDDTLIIHYYATLRHYAIDAI